MTRRSDAIGDAYKFNRAMTAGVMFDDMPVRSIGGCCGEIDIRQQQAECSFHLLAIDSANIGARSEDLFGVLPGRGYDRDTAGLGFEHPNGRNSRQGTDIGPSRHVDGNACSRKSSWNAVRREPATILHPGGRDRLKRRFRIAYAVD